jgi:hypothetical protein
VSMVTVLLKVLQCFLSLSEEIKLFLSEKGQPVKSFKDASWVCDMALMTDICGLVNYLNSKLQGKRQLVSELYNNASVFRMKVSLFHSQLSHS